MTKVKLFTVDMMDSTAAVTQGLSLCQVLKLVVKFGGIVPVWY